MSFDTIIRGGTIATAADTFACDIAIRYGRIVALGHDLGTATTIIDATDLGSPVVSLADIPPGEYWVQGFVNVYSEFHRADGHIVWMHDDRWEGQHWARCPLVSWGFAWWFLMTL